MSTRADELRRVRESIRALQNEIDLCRLPPASQLPPIPSLRPAESNRISAVERHPVNRPAMRPRADRPFGLTRFLIAGAIALPFAWYFAADKPHPPLTDEAGSAASGALPDTVSATRVAFPGIEVASAVPVDLPALRAVATAPEPTRDSDQAEEQDGARLSSQDAGPARTEVPIREAEAIVAPQRGGADQPAVAGSVDAASDAKAIEALIERGRQYFDAGDVAAARLFFSRAANAGDPAAAAAMGMTYDPAMLASRGVRGMRADFDKARNWYEKAAATGSSEASQLLETLQSAPLQSATGPAVMTTAIDRVRPAAVAGTEGSNQSFETAAFPLKDEAESGRSAHKARHRHARHTD